MRKLAFASLQHVTAVLKLPTELPDAGLLVGWSLEQRQPTRPIGFSYGDPAKTPATGYIDPIQLSREGHLITIAPTGSGKGVGCIVPALLQHRGPVIVIDPKGENVAVTARRRRELGQQVIVLDPMHITDQPRAAFNPLDIIDIHSPLAVDEVAAMAGSLWTGPVEARDRFWVSRAHTLVTGLLLHLLADAPPDQRNLAGLRALVGAATADPEACMKLLARSPHPEARQVASSLGSKAAETLGGVLAFAQELIDFLRGPLVQEATAASTFDVAGITRGDALSIYLVLPPHMLETHGRLLRLWISAMLALITRRRAKPAEPTLFILDEAAQLGTLPQLRQAITLLRGYGVQTWSFWQDVSQLQLLYPHDWHTMINNCRVLQCFGALNMNAARDMAELTGLGQPEQVLDLAPNEMILQLAGDEAIVARLPNYLNDPPFAGWFDANPYYDARREIMPKAMEPTRFYQRRSRPPRMPQAIRRTTPLPADVNDDAPDPLLERLLEGK